MGDISLTAANIRAMVANGAILLPPKKAGEALTVGQAVYIASDGDIQIADADVSAAAARAIGLVVESYDGETSIASGDPCTVCVFGPVEGFSGMTPGANVYLSDTAGALATATGTYDKLMGYSLSATCVFLNPEVSDPSSA